MKHLKKLGLAALAAAALAAFAASSASATTGEVKGVTRNESLSFTVSLTAGTSAVIKDTAGFSLNTCTGGSGEGMSQSPFTAGQLAGVPSAGSVSGCTRPVSAHKPGIVRVEHIPGTTNGTIFTEGAEATVGSAVGTLNCKAKEGTHVGVLTGKASGGATLDVNAVVNCGIVPSAKVEMVAEVTSPDGLGVSA